MKTQIAATCLILGMIGTASAAEPQSANVPVEPAKVKDIKAYCLDFNWGPGGPNRFAKPGLWADADPVEHVAWYKAMTETSLFLHALTTAFPSMRSGMTRVSSLSP